ncbi:MAG: hypothetical protein EOO23_03580 [Comamonadaceae bacterium]|nr:MAG: hypothetical protein EOO23_03580 [Comamonadaceae bacterium]
MTRIAQEIGKREIGSVAALWPAITLGGLAWAWPIHFYFYPRLHPDASYRHWISVFIVWTLCTAGGSIVLASLSFFRKKTRWPVVAMLPAIAYLLWFPWDIFSAILKWVVAQPE